MNAGLKTQPKALESPQTVAELKQVQDEMKANLEALLSATDEIDADSITSIRQKLKEIPLQITVRKIAETKKRLNEIHDELLIADDSKRLITSVMVERKRELNEQLELLQPFYERYNQCTLQLSYVQNDTEMLIVARREQKAVLFSLSDEIRK